MTHRNCLFVMAVVCMVLASGSNAMAGKRVNALTLSPGSGSVDSNMDMNDYIAVGVGRTFYLGKGGQASTAAQEVIEECHNAGLPAGADVDKRGCWVVASFDLGKADITATSVEKLDNVVGVLDDNPGLIFEIQGHTCSLGPLAYNQILSEKRAKAVYDYLIVKGIAAPRMSCRGFSFTRPAASNNTNEGRVENRRVQLLPLKQPQ